MGRPLVRSIVAAALGAICLISSNNTWLQRLSVSLVAQQDGDRMPGPIIVDPPGPDTGHSYVPASSIITEPRPALATIDVTYGAGFPLAAQAAFEAAVVIWESQIVSPLPIRVTANWQDLGSTTLGSAGPTFVRRDFAGTTRPATWFPIALADKMAGVDLDPGVADITARFNSNSTVNWYFGTDGNAGANYDFMSVVLHELGHGLGFLGSMTVSGGLGQWGLGTAPSIFPMVYDLFAINGSGQFLLDTTLFPNPSAALAAQLVSNSVFFTGFNAVAANAGFAPRLYAPIQFQSGSSYSHLDEATYPAGTANALMTPSIGPGQAIHDSGPIVRGVFTDTGWGPVGSCLYALSSAAFTTGAATKAGSVNVVVASGCAWTATSNASFITINAGSSGTGNGTVNYTIAANTGAIRTGTMTIAGVTFTVTQNAATTITGDFDSDGRAEVTVFRPSTGTWYIRNAVTGIDQGLVWGGSGDVPVVGDYDGDRLNDMAVFRPSNGTWYLRSSINGGLTTFLWGGVGDVTVQGDYEGDRKTDVAVFRPSNGTWYIRHSSTGALFGLVWGGAGDVAVPGDYDADGKTDLAVFRPSNGTWYIRSSITGALTTAVWGGVGDVAVPGDYDSDGRTDIAIFRASNGTWYIRNSSTGLDEGLLWGGAGDVPVPADYDGDGKTDMAVFRPSNGTWFIRNSSTGLLTQVVWGGGSDIPVLRRQ